MTKTAMLKIIFTIVFILLIVVSVALYVIDIVINSTPASENIIKLIGAVAVSAAGLIRLFSRGGKRRSLSFYESAYQKELNGAFQNSSFYRKKLLCAIRLYNEGRFGKAMKYLGDMKPVCKTKEDVYAVGLFLALTLTDAGYENDAITIYNQILSMNVSSSTIYGNLGSIYSGLGNYDEAIANLRLAIQNDDKNPAAYQNLAKLYFDIFKLEEAKEYAEKALSINHKFRASANLLAIIYSLEENEEQAQKYSHIAVSSGEDPERLRLAIEKYKLTKAKDEAPNASEADVPEEDETLPG